VADKKVERNVRSSDQEHPRTPTEKLTASLSSEGTLNTENAENDKARATLLDKFKDRDERYRREHGSPPGGSAKKDPAEEDEE